MKAVVYLTLVLLVAPAITFAHPGRTDASGCHTNKKTGEYHCHGTTPDVRTARTEARSEARNIYDKDCKDFHTQQEAQDFFISQGGPASDSHDLDRDRDGVACEDLRK